MQGHRQRTLTVVTVIGLLVATAAAGSPQKPGQGSVERAKPDLVVQQVVAARAGFAPDGDNIVNVTARVRNAARFRTCDGPLQVRIERRALVSGRETPFTVLAERTVERLCSDPTAVKIVMESVVVEDSVPVGAAREYRAIVDSTNAVSEGNEDNNVLVSEAYKGVCGGVDLGIEWLEVRRVSTGVRLTAHARNRCAGSCTGPVEWIVDESEAVADAAEVSQSMGDGVGPLREFRTNLGVRAATGEDAPYTVTIRAAGACRISDSCRITLRAGRDEARVDCR